MTKKHIFECMQQGAWVITPNKRLSHSLLSDYYHTREHHVIDRPVCLPYESFLMEQFKLLTQHAHTLAHPTVLSSHQERFLWKQVLHQESNITLNHQTLSSIQDAWQCCQRWLIDINTSNFSATPLTQRFQKWQRQFQHRLTELNAITQAQLAGYLCLNQLPISKNTFLWVAFDDFTPQQLELQRHLENLGIRHEIINPSTEQRAETYLYAAKDQNDEYQQLIAWLQTALTSTNRRIGVVVPDLQTQAKPLQRRLRRDLSADCFNVSLGQPLIDFPLVAHAFTCLRLQPKTLTQSEACLLLRSPFLTGSHREFLSRSQWMQTDELMREQILSLPLLAERIKSSAPLFANLLEHLSDYPDKATPNEWSVYFKKRLHHLGFPGDEPLNSESYQCLQRFLTLFDEYIPLQNLSSTLTFHEAMSALEDMATVTIFQAQSVSTQPIQILGLLEASGCEFDQLWIYRLTDQCLPQKVHFSPFIPIDLQRKLNMPHANHEREVELAQQLLHRFEHNSACCIMSYPRLIGDTPHLPCPLITHYPVYLPQPIETKTRPTELIPYDELYKHPLNPNETVSGGTTALSNQALCPFRGFATHRLHVKPPIETSLGPDPRERGQMLHQIMEKLWQKLSSQAQLLQTPAEVLQSMIHAIIDDVLTEYRGKHSESFSLLSHSVEKIRLARLTEAALDWEKQRPPFVIDALEQPFTIKLANLEFNVRVDRIDRLITEDTNETHTWVIDYKTSIPSHKPWDETRPDAPQLLLYALLNAHIRALLFLQLKTGRIICSGFSAEPTSVPGITTIKKDKTWASYQALWREQLSSLANELMEGHCPPEPTRSSTCTNCDVRSLCRKGFK